MRAGLLLLLAAGLALPLPTRAAQPALKDAATPACPPIANPNIVCRPYASPPVKPSSDGALRAVYFFSYTCPKCAEANSFVDAWSARRKLFVFRIHAVWDDKRLRDAAGAYYAFKRLGVTETLGPRLFDAISARQYRFDGAEELGAFAEANGVRADLMKRALASPRTTEQFKMAEHATRRFQIERVPFIAVNDRYAVSLRTVDAQTLADLEVLLDALVDEARPGR